MTNYELMYILPAKLEEAEKKAVTHKVDSLIKDGGGSVSTHNEWLTRKLAYPMDHIRQGIFVIAHLNLPGEEITKFNRELALDESILRHQLVKVDVHRRVSTPRRGPRVLPQEAVAALDSKLEPKVEEEKAPEDVSPEQLEKKLEELLSEEQPIVK